MCGFAGILNSRYEYSYRRDLINKMIEPIGYRGPDDKSIYIKDEISLAHVRLSIIDLEGGKQPIFNEDGTVCVIFTGEIFNYKELRKSLRELGHVFKTVSDTEVIVHLYEEYDHDFVHHMNGQFAIALWDENKKKLLLARDKTGIRPLFYYKNNNTLFFSSEIKSLLSVPSIQASIDLVSLSEIFTFWSPLPGNTVFKDIKSLLPGQLLIVNNGDTQYIKYWDWDFTNSLKSVDIQISDYTEVLKEKLTNAIHLQTRSDVPIGVYLSGGIDSAIVASLVNIELNQPLNTFSICFEEDEFNEREYQEIMSRELGTKHHTLTCTTLSIGMEFPDCIWHLECPVLRTAPVPLMMLSELAYSSGIKVILTGEGADEIFCGYDIFKESKIRRFWARNINSAWRPMLFKRLYPYLKYSPTAIDLYTRNFFQKGMESLDKPYFGHIPRWETTRRICKFFSDPVKQQLKQWDPYESIMNIFPDTGVNWDHQQKEQYIEAQTLLSGYILSSQGDRVSMANSVECRYPFLDDGVIDFASKLPSDYKLRGLKEKFILKESVSNLIPDTILNRVKQPYRAPDSQCFFHNGKPLDYVESLLSESQLHDTGLFNIKATRKLFNKCKKGHTLGFVDNMAFTGIISTLLINEFYVKNNGTPY